MKSFFVIVFWFFSLFSLNEENSQSINQILKVSDFSSSIQRSNFSFLFAIKSEITFTSVSLKTVRRFNTALYFKFFIQKFHINNLKSNFLILFSKHSIIYLTKQLIGLPIYLCKLTI